MPWIDWCIAKPDERQHEPRLQHLAQVLGRRRRRHLDLFAGAAPEPRQLQREQRPRRREREEQRQEGRHRRSIAITGPATSVVTM